MFWGFLHGMALVIHRQWTRLGLRMWSWLGWFITFNFVNIAWIFFRAKEFEDAIKVFKGMFGISGVVLPNVLLNKLAFLTQYGIEFGGIFENIYANKFTPLWLLAAFTIVLFFKNTSKYLYIKQFSYRMFLFNLIIVFFALSLMDRVSEFLYFNF